MRLERTGGALYLPHLCELRSEACLVLQRRRSARSWKCPQALLAEPAACCSQPQLGRAAPEQQLCQRGAAASQHR